MGGVGLAEERSSRPSRATWKRQNNQASQASQPFPSYMPALDGVRAFAVLAVLAYHGGVGWMTGGFLGVDVFFVLSGFLITSLLVDQWLRRGVIALGSFWAGRARRLLPALLLMLLAVALWVALVSKAGAFPTLRGDALATLGYVANWHLVGSGSNYFAATGVQSPFTHTWSLAIEEQFYLVWPLFVLALVRFTRSLRWLLAACVAGAFASAFEMSQLYRPLMSTSRLYYGTDSHAQCLLVGAALGVGLAIWAKGRGSWGPARSGTGRGVLIALGAVGASILGYMFAHISGTDASVYQGGIFVAALASAALLWSLVCVPRSPVAVIFSLRPVRWIGRVSYGIYLWHLPIFVFVNRATTGLVGYPLLVVRVLVTLSLATLSFYLVEKPIREHTFWRSLRAAVLLPVGVGATLAALLAATAVPATAATGYVPVGAVAQSQSQAGHSQGTWALAQLLDSSSARGGVLALRPIKMLLVGDSLAGSLGVGLGQIASLYGVNFVNEGTPSCSVSTAGEFRVLWYKVLPDPPCVAGDPGGLLRTWQQWVDGYNPDVVVYLGRAETFDQLQGGNWENLGELGFDAYVESALASGVRVLGSRGASVVLLTSPYYDSGEQGSGEPWPEDAPRRVQVDNAIIRQVAAASPSAYVVDLGAWLSPDDSYSPLVNGVPMRCADGAHLTPQAGEWVGARLLPLVLQWGRGHSLASRDGSWPGTPPSSSPPWYSKLRCDGT